MGGHDNSTSLNKSGTSGRLQDFVPVVRAKGAGMPGGLESSFRRKIASTICAKPPDFDKSGLMMPEPSEKTQYIIPLANNGYDYKSLELDPDIRVYGQEELMGSLFRKLDEIDQKYKRQYLTFFIKKALITLLLSVFVITCSITGITLIPKIGLPAALLIPLITIFGFTVYSYLLKKKFKAKIDKCSTSLKRDYEDEIDDFNLKFQKEFNMCFKLGYKGYWIELESRGVEEQIDELNNETSLTYSLYSLTERMPKTVPCSEERMISSSRKQFTSSPVPPLCFMANCAAGLVEFPQYSSFFKDKAATELAFVPKNGLVGVSLPTVPDENGEEDGIDNRECVRLSFVGMEKLSF